MTRKKSGLLKSLDLTDINNYEKWPKEKLKLFKPSLQCDY